MNDKQNSKENSRNEGNKEKNIKKTDKRSLFKNIAIGAALGVLLVGVLLSWAHRSAERGFFYGDHNRGGDRGMWNAFSENGEGKRGFRGMGGGMMMPDFATVDVDENGKIDEGELVGYSQRRMAEMMQRATQHVRGMFKVLDANGDGEIEEAEFNIGPRKMRKMWKDNRHKFEQEEGQS